MAGRNPDWTRNELILALDLYKRHRPAVLGNTSAEVIELSEILNRLARADRQRSPTHRNANGVAMKLLNFRPFDPEYTAAGKVGLHHTGRGDEQVWREFATDPFRLRQTAAVSDGPGHRRPKELQAEGLIQRGALAAGRPYLNSLG